MPEKPPIALHTRVLQLRIRQGMVQGIKKMMSDPPAGINTVRKDVRPQKSEAPRSRLKANLPRMKGQRELIAQKIAHGFYNFQKAPFVGTHKQHVVHVAAVTFNFQRSFYKVIQRIQIHIAE